MRARRAPVARTLPAPTAVRVAQALYSPTPTAGSPLTSVASGGGAGYGGGGAGLNIWTIGAYYESVFGRQVQFEGEGNIYSISSLSSGGGAGGSYINYEVVSDFALTTAQNANPTAGVRSPGSAALYKCAENTTLETPITEGP